MEEKYKYFKLANDLNQTYKEKLSQIQMHCRGNVKAMSLVSLNANTPEMGFSGIKTKEKFHTFIDSFKLEKPQRETSEKLLQATIIKEALNHPSHLLPFGDNIQFITSELVMLNKSNEKIINDILGFSQNKELYIIELKSSRFLTELENQVNDFENIVKDQPDFFYELLKIYELDWDKSSIKKAIVWPKNHSRNKVFQDDIIEFTYEKEKLKKEEQFTLIIEEAKCV